MILRTTFQRAARLFTGLCAVVCLLGTDRPAHADVPAAGALVMDAASERILYAKNPNLKLRPASTTKLMTAMVALDRLNPDDVVRVSEHAAQTPGVSPRLRAGERYTVHSLLTLALMRSVNSAAVALAEATAGSEDAFAELMNKKAAEIGADNTRFINASGLPGPNQYVTAYDLAKIMKNALKYPLITELINTRTQTVVSQGGRKLPVKNTNELLWDNDGMLGGKTGYTREARHCLVAATRKGGNTIISAVLGEPHRADLWQDTSRLAARGDDVMHRRAEPIITYSTATESPVVFATYGGGSSKKSKKAVYTKNKKSSDGKPTAVKGKKGKKTKKAVKKSSSGKKSKKVTAGNTRTSGRS